MAKKMSEEEYQQIIRETETQVEYDKSLANVVWDDEGSHKVTKRWGKGKK